MLKISLRKVIYGMVRMIQNEDDSFHSDEEKIKCQIIIIEKALEDIKNIQNK